MLETLIIPILITLSGVGTAIALYYFADALDKITEKHGFIWAAVICAIIIYIFIFIILSIKQGVKL